MGCACNKNRTQYEVVTVDGRIVPGTSNERTANKIAERYPGSTVRKKPKK